MLGLKAFRESLHVLLELRSPHLIPESAYSAFRSRIADNVLEVHLHFGKTVSNRCWYSTNEVAQDSRFLMVSQNGNDVDAQHKNIQVFSPKAV